jgi:hypothetical protein
VAILAKIRNLLIGVTPAAASSTTTSGKMERPLDIFPLRPIEIWTERCSEYGAGDPVLRRRFADRVAPGNNLRGLPGPQFLVRLSFSSEPMMGNLSLTAWTSRLIHIRAGHW